MMPHFLDFSWSSEFCTAVSIFEVAFGKIPGRREWLPAPVFCPGESHGQKSLAGYSPWGGKELDMTERLSLSLPLSFTKCLQGRNTFHQFCQILRFSQTCMHTPAPSFLLAEFLTLRVFSTYNDCGSPFLCLPGGGTTIQVCGFTFIGSLVQLSAPVLGISDRELPEWVRCGLAHGVLGMHMGQLRGFGGEIFPRLMSWLPDGTKDAISWNHDPSCPPGIL